MSKPKDLSKFFDAKASKHLLFTADAKFAVKAPTTEAPYTTLTGYALVWNTLSKDRGGYKVRLKPYSANVMASSLALFHHDNKLVLGNTENGTLRFTTDSKGLGVEIDLPDTSAGRDAAELVAKKYIRGMSFGMLLDPEPEFEGVEEGGQTILEFSKFWMDEVTITAIPAFADTSVEIADSGDDKGGDEGGNKQDDSGYSNSKNRIELERMKLRILGL
jgi:HK97 family phage prohead protease